MNRKTCACVLVVYVSLFVGKPHSETGNPDTALAVSLKAVAVDVQRVLKRGDVGVESEPVRFQDTEFYRTIIDNNLFRPLGWRKPVLASPYRLLGTMVSGATDGVWVSKAVISVRGQVRVVEQGKPLDSETRVLGIDQHSVVLETAGKARVLRLPMGDVLLRGR